MTSDTPRTDRVARGRTEIASPTVVDVEFARTLERELAQARGNHQACTRMRESLERKLDEAEAALRAAPVSEEREECAKLLEQYCLPYEGESVSEGLPEVLRRAARLLRAPQQQEEAVMLLREIEAAWTLARPNYGNTRWAKRIRAYLSRKDQR